MSGALSAQDDILRRTLRGWLGGSQDVNLVLGGIIEGNGDV